MILRISQKSLEGFKTELEKLANEKVSEKELKGAKENIAGRLKYIAEKEHIDIDDESIDYIAKVANGGMRDAIAMLDKCNSINSTIRMQQVTDTLGLTNYDAYLSFLVHLVQKDVTKAVEDISNVFYAGKDMKQFMGQFLQCVCDVCNYYVFNKKDLNFKWK